MHSTFRYLYTPKVTDSIMRSLLVPCFLVVLISLPRFKSLQTEVDVVIRNGMIYDGSGGAPYRADIAIQSDTIAAIGELKSYAGKEELNAHGLAVSPGFINMLSWADNSLALDGYSVSDIKQGVTLEIFGEGFSPGPIRRKNKEGADSLWTTLGGYFDFLLRRGITPNVGSFVGATSVRIHELDFDNRPPTPGELERMQTLVKNSMEEGALGLGSSLIYAPATYATTEELIALAKVAAAYGGSYITHMRSESDFIIPALDETIRIAKEASIPAEIYHLKINFPRNWQKADSVFRKIDSARETGIQLTANMYPYTVSGTGLNSRLPSWVQEGGAVAMRKRMRNRAVLKKVLYEMEHGIPSKNSDPDKVMLMRFRLDSLNRLYKGKTLSEAARIHGKSADRTAIDLIVKDKSRIECLYYLQSEDIVRSVMKQAYVSFGSDGGSYSIEDPKEPLADHPRAFGTFARVLGKYVRDENILSLPEAIRKLTALPASNLKLSNRGRIKRGYFADIVIFDPETIADLATFEEPHQYAKGVEHVFVNGVQVLENGNHTLAKPGRIIYGPGYKKKAIY